MESHQHRLYGYAKVVRGKGVIDSGNYAGPCVVEGVVEQRLDRQMRVLRSGDAVFIPPDVVHASFNVGQSPAKMLAILGPCVGRENGYEVTEVADQEPWKGLRG